MAVIRFDKEDFEVIMRNLGAIIFMIGFLLFVPVSIAYIYREPGEYLVFLYPAAVAILTGYSLKYIFRSGREIGVKHAMIIAGLAWLIIPLLSSYPFLGNGFSFLNAYFEAMSGYTTTGLTVIDNVEDMPKSLLFWRGFIQWIGGLGVIMLFLIVFVHSSSAIRRLYTSEARTERITPTISKTVRYIWRIYIFYTIIGTFLFYVAGMDPFDALMHTFTGLATAGFSTKGASIGYYHNSWIEAVAVFVMFLGGISFIVHYRILTGERRAFFRDPEVLTYLYIIIIATLLVAFSLMLNGGGAVNSFRLAVFHVMSAITTTGFSIAGISNWPDFSKAILVALMISGGCAGSTSGGIKIFRTLILLKLSAYETQKGMLPEAAVTSFKIKGRVLETDEILRVASFFFLYVSLIFFNGILLSEFGYRFLDGVFISSSAQSNVGLVAVSPQTWFALPAIPKTLLIIEMWVGRLEIFPVLILINSLLLMTRRKEKA